MPRAEPSCIRPIRPLHLHFYGRFTTAKFDLSTVLLQGTFTTSQQGTPLDVAARYLPSSAVMVNVSAIAATGTYVFTVDVASSQGGVYTPVASLTWPAGVTTTRQLEIGYQGKQAQFVNNQSRWLRLTLQVSGGTPSVTCTAWLTKSVGGGVGLGARAGDLISI